MLALVSVVIDFPYRRERGKAATVADIGTAEAEFQSAVAAGRLSPDGRGPIDRDMVRTLWPGKGQGNAFKAAMDARSVNWLASAKRRTSRPEALARRAGPDGGPRDLLLATVGLTIDNREDRRDLFRAAIREGARAGSLCAGEAERR